MASAIRQINILSFLSAGKLRTINDLAKNLNVSHMTVRRDIQKMEKKGLVNRIHGAIGIPETASTLNQNGIEKLLVEPSRDEKSQMQLEEKRQIAVNALNEVESGMTIYLDAGTTIYELAKLLVVKSDLKDLTIISNDMDIVYLLLKNSRYRIYHTGGLLNRENKSCVGPNAAQSLSSFQINKAFVSTSSWNTKGVFTPSEEKLILKKVIFDVSNECYLLSDSSKFNKISTFKIVDLIQFSKVFSDTKHMEPQDIEDLASLQIKIIN